MGQLPTNITATTGNFSLFGFGQVVKSVFEVNKLVEHVKVIRVKVMIATKHVFKIESRAGVCFTPSIDRDAALVFAAFVQDVGCEGLVLDNAAMSGKYKALGGIKFSLQLGLLLYHIGEASRLVDVFFVKTVELTQDVL